MFIFVAIYMNEYRNPKLTPCGYQSDMETAIYMAAQLLLVAGIMLWERRRNPGPSDWLRNLQAWALDIGASLIFLPLIPLYHNHTLLNGSDLPFALAFILFLLMRDLTEFLFHVCQHRFGFLWRMHSLHHSDPEMSALTTNRHFWGDQVIKALTIWPVTVMVIAPTYTIVLAYAAVSLYNYFIHANLKVNFGRWSWLLNCPAYHRRHHSRVPEHYNANFAALFPIWDVICGTYRRPDGWPPTGQATAPKHMLDVLVWPLLKSEPAEEAAEASA